MRFQERTAALFNSRTREMTRKYRSTTRIWYFLTDLSKAFDCLPHDFRIAKRFAYGFDDKALLFIYDYLRHRK